jgi:hypothetical protein
MTTVEKGEMIAAIIASGIIAFVIVLAIGKWE